MIDSFNLHQKDYKNDVNTNNRLNNNDINNNISEQENELLKIIIILGISNQSPRRSIIIGITVLIADFYS